MLIFSFFLSFYSFIISCNCFPLRQTSLDALKFLTQYGYLETKSSSNALTSGDYLSQAIIKMQRFANINPTGVLDLPTLRLMYRKRCGLPDIVTNNNNKSTKKFSKRYVVQGSKWENLQITWSIENFPSTMDKQSVLNELRKALYVWSNETPLEFKQIDITSGQKGDIVFAFFQGNHGDSYPFNGPGYVLAHAFFPGEDIGGDVHFDADEDWTIADVSTGDSIGLFDVAAHELGHSLGLQHSNLNTSLMFPYYNKLRNNFQLPYDDLRGILHIYGYKDFQKHILTRITTPPTKPYTTETRIPTEIDENNSEPPDTCDTTFDAVASIRGETFFFKGKYFWRVDKDKRLDRNYAVPIDAFWKGLPKDLEKIDAVYERPTDQKIMFFIGQQYWVFEADKVENDYPRPIYILGFPQNLQKIDAIMIWSHNGKTYFFSGDKYWRFDDKRLEVGLDYPRNIAVWKGIPANLDAAFQWSYNGVNYFFKGKYCWEFDNNEMSVIPHSPFHATTFWFNSYCSKREKK